MIMGVGVNLNTRSFPEDLPHAGSVFTETGKKLSAEEFVPEFLKHFDEAVEMSLKEVLDEIALISATLGRNVRAGEITGRAVQFEEDGSLVIDSADGPHTIVVGDVSVRGLYGYVD